MSVVSEHLTDSLLAQNLKDNVVCYVFIYFLPSLLSDQDRICILTIVTMCRQITQILYETRTYSN